jgi:hypothetical protein
MKLRTTIAVSWRSKADQAKTRDDGVEKAMEKEMVKTRGEKEKKLKCTEEKLTKRAKRIKILSTY